MKLFIILVEASAGFRDLCHSLVDIVPADVQLKICDEFHISLTKTVILKYHWIESFVGTLKQHLESFRR